MRTGIILFIDCSILVCCLARVPSLADRPTLPFTLSHNNSSTQVSTVIASKSITGLQPGDKVTAWNNNTVHSAFDVEYLLSRAGTGDSITLSVDRNGVPRSAKIVLPPIHNRRYLLFIIITGCLTWFLAVFLLLQRFKNASTIYAHWAMIALAVSVMTAWEGGPAEGPVSVIGNILFFVGYMGVATLFYLLVSFFPTPSPSTASRRFWLRFVPGTLVLVVTTALHVMSSVRDDVQAYYQFRLWFDLFHVVVLLYIIAALAVLVQAFRNARQPDERKKLQWILSGCIVGPMPFLLLTAVPNLVAPQWSIAEEYTLIPLGAVPVSFVIAIMRYQAFNIELLIRRSTTYALVIALIVLAYALFVGIIGGVFGFSSGITSAGAALVTALLFEPLRKAVYRFVDRRFFRIHYNFRTSARGLLELLKTSPDISTLGTMIIEETQRLVPTERTAVITFASSGTSSTIVTNSGFDEGRLQSTFHELFIKQKLSGSPVGLTDYVEPGVACTAADESKLNSAGVALFFPIHSTNAGVPGCIAVSAKRSGSRFSAEDIDLFRGVALQTGLTVDRILLEEKLRLEKAESERLAQVSKLKSDFVSFVSHEFRTPLTSIRIFTELLEKQGEPLNEQQQHSLHVIEGEVDRLNRMVTNILNAASIEGNGKQYHLVPVQAGSILRGVAKRFEYQLNKDGFSADVILPGHEVIILADSDALGLALGNLIDNAIKYSTDRREILLRLKCCANNCIFEIQDFGKGIPVSTQPHLFDMFYREPIHRGHIAGWGLGLPLVKHIVNAHGGDTEVKSEPGKGSIVSIILPLHPQSL